MYNMLDRLILPETIDTHTIQIDAWRVQSATYMGKDQLYLTSMCYISAFPMRNMRILTEDERIIQRLPQIAPWRNDWGRAGDIALIAFDPNTQKRLGAIWCRLFPAMDDFVAGFYDQHTPVLAMAVEAPYRQRGIGGSLLTALKQAAYQQGYGALSLGVSASNHASSFYQQHGFLIQNTPDTHTPYNLVTMSIDLVSTLSSTLMPYYKAENQTMKLLPISEEPLFSEE
ncbi:GNAT family N-acetyltransferase [Dictyobacter arantiisoli]|uniref:N-acetyltransferase domain-containing protein n=1 Tax=Dictyobacter arantiisoli TaxID=2014874 RepID=A0A5A5THF6_9CHLR|nr:GNAT family N-acetyltransferase [Dictyobacter arantiisoli]GCF10459.1 hypothetical protein KDI_40230 [Dictyobacter arantiisoli]